MLSAMSSIATAVDWIEVARGLGIVGMAILNGIF